MDERLFAFVVVSLTGLLLFWSWISRKARSRNGIRLPPGPRGLPVLGSLLSLGAFPHKSLFKLSRKYGPVMFLRLGSVPTLVVGNGDIMKEVLQTNDQVFASRPRLILPTALFYDNMDMAFTPYSPHWRQARKICNSQLFTAPRLSNFSGLIEGEIMAIIQSALHESELGRAVNMCELFSALAMNIVTQMMWGQRHRGINGSSQSETDKFDQIIKTVTAISGSNNLADYLPFLKSFIMRLTGLEKKAQEAHKELDEFFEQVISEREQQLSKKAKTTTDEDDFVDVLLKLTKQSSEDSQPLSRVVMKAIIMDMLIGGTDTTSVTFDWTLAELMKHPDVMRKAQDELSTVVGNHRLVTQADLPKLKYLGAIVKEGLRRHGPGPIPIPHFSLSDCKVAGYDVPANTLVLLNLYAVHHDPAVWDKPMEFNPDRFLESDLDYKGRHFEYLPFSSGRRICPGLNLASIVLNLGLAQFLHTVSWSLPQGKDPGSISMMENSGLIPAMANPLMLIAKPRLSQHIISSVPTVS